MAEGEDDLLRRTVMEFRNSFFEACDGAIQERGRDWACVWDAVVRRAADDLLQPGCDAFSVRRRVERLVYWYCRATSDPVRLFSTSLPVQEAVIAGLAQLDRPCGGWFA